MIVGFDTDDHTVFDLQRRFLAAARIPLAMVNILTAIPRTPLYERLGRQGRLDDSGELSNFGTISTNVIPTRINRQDLCDGYLELMRDLYALDAYFGRMDSLYLEGKPIPPSAHTRWLRRHPWRRIKAQAWTVLEVTYIIIALMRGAPDPVLKRDYRRRLWAVIRRRPRLRLLRIYAVKCALHYHFDRLIAQMKAERAELPPEVDSGSQLASVAAADEAADITGAREKRVMI